MASVPDKESGYFNDVADERQQHRGAAPLRLLVLTSDRFPPFRPAAKAIFGEEFTDRGHIVDWLMQAEDPSADGGVKAFGNGHVYLAPMLSGETRFSRLKKHITSLTNDFRVFSLVRKHRYDIVQVKDKYITAVLALVAARLFGSKFCFWLAYPHPEASLYGARHGMARYPLLYWLRGHFQAFLLYKIILRSADHAFVQSEQMKLDIAAKGIPASRMTPVPGSLNLDTIPYRGGDDQGPAGPVVLYVGTLIRKRRLDFVVRMFAQVLARRPDARLVFLGKGHLPEDDAFLQDEIRRLDIPESAVEFPGAVPMEEVWGYIERAAVCLSPYYPTFELNSTSPTKLIEYMAMGRPVVANEHPEQSLVIAESQAGLCVPWDEDAFAEAVLTLLNDEQLAASMAERGRRWVQAHRTNAIMAEVVEREYRKIVPDTEVTSDSSAADGR